MITMYEERRRETRRRCLVYSVPRLEPSWTSGHKGSNRNINPPLQYDELCESISSYQALLGIADKIYPTALRSLLNLQPFSMWQYQSQSTS